MGQKPKTARLANRFRPLHKPLYLNDLHQKTLEEGLPSTPASLRIDFSPTAVVKRTNPHTNKA